MMKKRTFTSPWVIIFTLLFGLISSTHATHFAGGEITYRYLSSDNYEVSVKLYRDCDGITFPSSVDVDISPGPGLSSINLSQVSITEITPICPGVITTCSSGSSAIAGGEEWLYRGTVNLPPLTAGQQYTLSHDGCCRNNAITNLVSGGSSSFYISTSLNPNNIPRNNSPEFIELPVVNVCLNQQVNFPVGAFDVDGDDLVYSLGDCLESANNSVNYVSGLSGTNPLITSGGVSIDAFSGMVSFVPTQIQVAIICVKVEEFRGGVKIGEIFRDVQFQVRACSDNTPVVASIPNQTAPVGVPLCITVSATDADIGDVITLGAASGLSGATFSSAPSTSSATGTFCWTPSAFDQGRSFNVIISAKDNHCPINLADFQAFVITVPSITNCDLDVSAVITGDSCSNGIGAVDITPLNAVLPLAYSWSGPNGFTSSQEDISGLTSEFYSLLMIDARNCLVRETFEVPLVNNLDVTGVVTEDSCFFNGAIDIMPINAALPITYSWAGTNGFTSNQEDINGLAADFYSLLMVDAKNCEVRDTFEVPLVNTLNVTAVILEDSCLSGGSIGAIDITTPNSTPPLTYSWSGPNGFFSNQEDISGLQAGFYNLTMSGSGNCQLSEIFEVPLVDLTPPEITCPTGPIVSCSPVVNYGPIVATDACALPNSGGYLYQAIPFAPLNLGSGWINESLGDDDEANNLPIGFDFNFYGNSYNTFNISSNGFISFSPNTNGCCSGQNIPSPLDPNNLIAGAWEDLDPGNGGQPSANVIRYQTIGTSPNRKLVVEFFNVDHFPSGNRVTFQIILNEGSDDIEIHTTNMPSDGGSHTQGVENINGTLATTVPGRNAANWSITNDAVRFWLPTVTSQLAGLPSGSTFPIGTTTNTFEVQDLAGNSAQCSFDVIVLANTLDATSVVTDDVCGSIGSGAIDITPLNAALPYTYSWTGPNGFTSNQQDISGLKAGFYNLLMTESGNCLERTFEVQFVDNDPPVITCPGPITVVSCSANVTYNVTATDACALSNTGDYVYQAIPFAPLSLGSGWINESLGDDDVASNLPIGFGFNFYGNTYSTFNISSNGFISFSPTSSACCSGQNIPSPSSPNNLIAAAWEDLDPGNGGQPGANVVRYQTIGTSPNRKLVVEFFNVDHFPSGNRVTFQIILYEGSDFIEIHTTNMPSDGGSHTQGIENSNGTSAITVPGRNRANWSITNDAVRFWIPPAVTQIAGLPSGSAFPVGTTTNTFQIQDSAGNSAQCSFDVIVLSSAAPTAICQDITVSLDGSGSAIIAPSDVDGGSGCGTFSLSLDRNTFDCDDMGSQVVTLTATNAMGSTNCTAEVYMDDATAKPGKLAKQNCGSCGQLRIFYCQFDNSPSPMNHYIDGTVQTNANYGSGNSLYWYNDVGGSQGAPLGGTGAQPPIPNLNNTGTYFYWVAQVNSLSGCLGEAIRVRVRVRKGPIVTFNQHPLPFCLSGQLDLAAWVSDANNVTDRYYFYDGDPDLPGANLLGSVPATNGTVDPNNHVIVPPQVGINNYWVVAVNEGNANVTTCTVKASMTIPVAVPADLAPVPNLTVNNADLVYVPFSSTNADYIIWVDHSSFNNPNIGLLGGVGWGVLYFVAQNNGPNPLTAMIRAIAYKGNCAGQVRDFYITVNPSPLRQTMPHSLTLAAYKLNVHDLRLEWDVVYDDKLSHFEVEKLKDGVSYSDDVNMLINADNWEKLGNVDFNTAKHSYSFIDREGMSNVTKYRLKLVHKDGSSFWSDVVEIRFDFYDGDRFVVYPNPSDGVFQLKSILPITSEWTYQISDAMGRIVQSGMLTEEDQQFDLQAQAIGVYYIVLRNQEGMRYLKRIVKK